MKKLSYFIVLILILGLVLTGCTLLSNIGQAPATEQSGITYLTKGLFSGLVGLWSFDEGENPTIAYDSSGTTPPNNGVVVGATYVPNTVGMGQALSFNGDGDYVEVADSASLDITGDLTIEAWVKFDSFAFPHSFVVGKDTTGQRSYGLFVDGGYYAKTGKVGFIVFSASSYTIHWGDTALNTDQWYHIAGTYDYIGNENSVMEVYVNGNSDSTETSNAVGPIYSGSANLQIGARQYPPIPSNNWRCFVDGLIDEVRIWNTALTADQLIRYGFKGLMAPYALPGQKTFKLGRTIPLKWQYTDFDGNVVDSLDATPAVSYQFVGGGSGDGALVDTDDPGSSGLRYDSGTKTWQFNWQTKELSLTGIYNIWIASDLTGQVNGPFPIELQ
jgi:hypothetical protein